MSQDPLSCPSWRFQQRPELGRARFGGPSWLLNPGRMRKSVDLVYKDVFSFRGQTPQFKEA
jgi:hypothetical protein